MVHQSNRKRNPWIASITDLCAILGIMTALQSPSYSTPIEGQTAPGFTLPGLDGQPHSLMNYAGQPTVVFFFCGCKWCHETARSWSAAQGKSKALVGARTVVVYSGGPSEAKLFVKQTGLSPAATTMLLDKFLDVSVNLYQAEPCPRVFVLTAKEKIYYTNDHKNDTARTISSTALIGHVVAALNRLTVASVSSKNPQPVAVNDTDGAVYLTPIAGNGVLVTGTGMNREAAYDFGTVKQSVTKTIEHVFQFRNDTGSDISIDHIQPSCGCTNAFIGNTTDYPVIVKSGETIDVTAFVDLTDLYPASVEKSVMIFRTRQTEPLAFIDITGNLTP